MKIRPVWAIFAFVTSSILVAGAYHSLTLAQKDSTGSPIAWDLKYSQFQNLFGSSATVCEESHQMSQWKDFPPIFRSARYRHGGDFQLQCMKASAEEMPSIALNCSSPASAPGCAQNEETLVTYNVLLDLTDCFEIAQREFLPLISSQTGPRLENFSIDEKATTGLMREKDWVTFQNAWPGQLAQLKSSEKTSCRRLGSLFEKTLLPEMPEVCSKGETPQQNLIVMLAAAARFSQITSEVRDAWDPALIDPLMAELDTRIEDRMILRYWTHLLAYFENSEKAISIAKSFVEARSEYSERIKPGELSWSQMASGDRQPASVGPVVSDKTLTWPHHLEKKLSTTAHSKMERVANWLNWVRQKDLSGACATELWTLEIAPVSAE